MSSKTIGLCLILSGSLVCTIAQAATDIKSTSKESAHKPMSAKELDLMRLEIRHSFLGSLSTACGKRFPDQAQTYQRKVLTWRIERQARLDEAARLVISRNSREDAKEMTGLVNAEMNELQNSQLQKLGISMQKPPTAAECEALITNVTKLP